jgi:hypothetical protein
MAASVLIGKARRRPERAEQKRREDWDFATILTLLDSPHGFHAFFAQSKYYNA